MNMYFIALVAPEEINSHALKWKRYLFEKYGCSVALRSPAHITLIPPFRMKGEVENKLINMISVFSETKDPFVIQLENYSCFQPRVLFIDVIPNENLNKLAASIQTYIGSSELIPVKKDNRPFHPHITLATRDIYKKAFHEAWEQLSTKKYSAEWIVNSISLLKHNGSTWDVIHTTEFGNK